MRFHDLTETSGTSLSGSFTRDLIHSKVWLLTQLSQISPSYQNAYILGSWYNNLAVINHLGGILNMGKYINVELDKAVSQAGERILDYLEVPHHECMAVDGNSLDYRQLTPESLVINTSLNDIQGLGWWDNIPSGTLVALQCRDHNPEPMPYESLPDILGDHEFAEIIFQGSLRLQDPETKYTRSMLMGFK